MVYDKLTDDIKRKLNNLEAVHYFTHSRSKIDRKLVSEVGFKKFPRVIQSMVKINPVNKKKQFTLDLILLT